MRRAAYEEPAVDVDGMMEVDFGLSVRVMGARVQERTSRSDGDAVGETRQSVVSSWHRHML